MTEAERGLLIAVARVAKSAHWRSCDDEKMRQWVDDELDRYLTSLLVEMGDLPPLEQQP